MCAGIPRKIGKGLLLFFFSQKMAYIRDIAAGLRFLAEKQIVQYDKGGGLHLPKDLSGVNGSSEPDAAVTMPLVRTENEVLMASSRSSTPNISDCALQAQNGYVS